METSEQSAGRRRKVVTLGVVGAVMLVGTAGAVGVLNKGEAGTVTATTPIGQHYLITAVAPPLHPRHSGQLKFTGRERTFGLPHAYGSKLYHLPER